MPLLGVGFLISIFFTFSSALLSIPDNMNTLLIIATLGFVFYSYLLLLLNMKIAKYKKSKPLVILAFTLLIFILFINFFYSKYWHEKNQDNLLDIIALESIILNAQIIFTTIYLSIGLFFCLKKE